MATKLEKEVRALKLYAIVATLGCVVLIASAFTLQSRRQKFDEIDVERLNIVEHDGKLKMVISNNDLLPGPTIGGKTYQRQGTKSHGIIFYNELGDESGGLINTSEEKDGKYAAGTLLAFDQYKHDQVLGLMYNERDGRSEAGFNVTDRSATSNFGAEQRVFVGRTTDKAARVTLYDQQGRPRLQMFVDATGTAKLEFLDDGGKVTKSLP